MSDNEFDDDIVTKKPRKKGGFIIVILLLVILCAGFYYDTYLGEGYIKNALLQNKTEKSNTDDANPNVEETPTISSKKNPKKVMDFESDSKSIFKTFGKSFIHCTKDGVKYYSAMGNQKWNDTYTMTSPIVVSEGKYTAVADLMGRTVKVYNEDGVAYSLTTDSSISRISLNVNGYLAVMMKEKIDIYNNEGTKIKGRSEGVANIFPMDVDISNDNRIFAVSYLDTSDIKMISKVLLFYLNEEEGKDFTDKMFAAQDNIEGIIPYVNFTNRDMLVAVSDTNVIAMDLAGKLLWKIELTNEISQFGFVDEYIIIAYGDVISGKDGKSVGTVEWINSKGEVSSTFDVKEEVSYMNASANGIMMGAGNDYYAVSNSGKLIWSHKAIQDITDILFMENANNVLYITKNSAEVMDMTKNVNTEDTKTNDSDEVKQEDKQVENKANPKDESDAIVKDETETAPQGNNETEEKVE